MGRKAQPETVVEGAGEESRNSSVTDREEINTGIQGDKACNDSEVRVLPTQTEEVPDTIQRSASDNGGEIIPETEEEGWEPTGWDAANDAIFGCSVLLSVKTEMRLSVCEGVPFQLAIVDAKSGEMDIIDSVFELGADKTLRIRIVGE